MAKDVGNLRTRLSFEKTGESNLTELRRDLRGIQSEMNNFRASSRAYRTSIKGMRQESDILTRRLQVQRERVAELKRRYDEAKRTTGENSARTRDLATQYNNAQAQMKRTEQQLERLNRMIRIQESRWTQLGQRLDTAGKKMQEVGRGLTSFGRAYSMRVTAPIVGAGLAALKVGMDFEEGMSKVQAISGATGQDLELLRNQAKELGETTRFSATEAASGMEFLAMAGWETQEILSGMPGLLDLAASSNMDLGRAADIASNIISGFNMEASEATRVADVLAKGASTANTNVEQLGGAMKYAAPIANTLGLELEGLTAAVGFMSDAGIQGEQAGRQLRQGLLRLANPTGEASKLINELGINVFDADGNMKDMHEIVSELEKGFAGMTSQARASALAILFGSESTAGWSTLLDRGAKDLRNYTKELENSEGSAEEMAKTMQDNAKGAIIEFRSALEGAGIAISEHMIPHLTNITEKATELVRKFGELDKEQQKQILKWVALVAAVGPASLVLGQTATAIGGVLRVAGSLSKALGVASGTGLIGRLALLGGPAGVAVLAGGALAFLGKKAYDAYKDKHKLNEVSTETTDKLWEEASAVEELADKYDALQEKSKLTTEEFGRLLDITKELEVTQNPAKIAELEAEYERLAEKSGLSNKELEDMLNLNNDIIAQSPNVAKAHTDQGNAIVKNTDAVREHIEALKELAIEELQWELAEALENEGKIREDNKRIAEELAEVEQNMNELLEIRKMPLDEVDARLAEINEKMQSGLLTQEEYLELEREEGLLLQQKHGHIAEAYENLKKQRDALMKKQEANDEELAKLENIKTRMAELLLAEVDINWEKGKGLEKLDERISKLQKEREELVQNTSEEDKKSQKYQEQLSQLDDAISKHENIRDKIRDETGYQSEQNKKIDDQNRKLNETNYRLEHAIGNVNKIGREQDSTNRKIDAGTTKAERLTKEAGKDVNKNIDIDDQGGVSKLNREARSPVRKAVNLVASWANLGSAMGTLASRIGSTIRRAVPGFADGGVHKGGPFIAGEEGWELGRYRDRWEILNFGLYNRPSGYQVFTHDESKRILRQLNSLPAYADGARPPQEANRMIEQIETSNVAQPLIVQLVTPEKRVLAEMVVDDITEIQQRNERVRNNFA